MKISKQLGMRISYLRKQKKWSQEELSFNSGVNKNYICDIENGRRNPTLDILSRIAVGLDVTLEFLFKGIQSFDE